MGAQQRPGRPRGLSAAGGSTCAPMLWTVPDSSGAPLHTPVMSARVVKLLSPALDVAGAVLVDCTVGMAGHAAALLAASPQARLVGIDRDADALSVAEQHLLQQFPGRFDLVRARFDEVGRVLDDLGLHRVQAVLADLGLSSLQIDRRERGFAYAVDAPLDMRMDDRLERTAADVLNTYPQADLVRVLRAYGEEPNAVRIARAIVAERGREPFERSAHLVDTISRALPAAARHGGHPAKRTFQALRIEVNGELDALAGLLPAALGRLAVAGRMAVLAYHSLEDRMVKQAFAAATSDAAPRRLPVVPDDLAARFVPLTRGAERPHPAETAANPRSASARLRGVQRIRPGSIPAPEEQ